MNRTTIDIVWIRRAAWTTGVLLLGLLLGTCEFVGPGGSSSGEVSESPCVTDAEHRAIADQAGLEAIKDNPSASYCLTKDITLIGEWVPLKTFTGTLDGKGRAIKDLTINDAADPYIGFFKELGTGASVKNLIFSQSNVKGKGDAGVLAGTSDATIENLQIIGGAIIGRDAGGLVGFNTGMIVNSHAGSVVDGEYTAGGLVGNNYGGTIANSYATGAVSGESNVGGLVGINEGTIKASYASGAVNGISYVGGLVGTNEDELITSSYATGVVTGVYYVGGLVGENSNAAITNSYASGAVIGDTAGGLVGDNYGGTITNSYASGAVDGDTAGGLVGLNAGSIENSHFDTTTTRQANGIGKNTNSQTGGVQGSAGAPEAETQGFFVNWDFSTIWIFNTGAWPTLVDPAASSEPCNKAIENEAGLKAMIYNVACSYFLTGDITLTENWSPLATFTGVLHGNDHTIRGLVIDDQTTNASGFPNSVGFFRELGASASVKNLIFDAPNVTGGRNTGVLAGTSEATIENLQIVGGTVTGGDGDTGGLVGVNHGSIEKSSYASGVVSNGYNVGGLVGLNGAQAAIANSYAISTVTATTHNGTIGGLVGDNDGGAITDSYAGGAVSTTVANTNYIGGLVGDNTGAGTITNSYAGATVTIMVTTPVIYAGGLVGRNWTKATITNSYASGAVTTGIATVTGTTGGLVGINEGSIGASYASGTVSAEYNAGGLVGWNTDTGTIINSYASGAVTTTTASTTTFITIGGLVGNNHGSIENSHARGAVTTTITTDITYAGGLVGENDRRGIIKNSYFDTAGTRKAAGIGEDANNQIGNVHGLIETNILYFLGVSYNTGANPRIEIFVAWDFAIWDFANQTWPTLAW